jgi:beta-N-acetylhexosaminidase
MVVILSAALAACQSDEPPVAAPPISAAPPPPSSAVAVPSAPVPSSAGPPADCATATLGRLKLPALAGQVLMVGTPVDDPTQIRETVERYRLGGVFLRGRSTSSAADLRSAIGDVQKRAEVPLLISADQEGGDVQTLKGPDFPVLPSALRLGDRSATEMRETTSDSARRLRGIGVTLNLAPVADTVPTSVGEANPPIGAFHRQYGSNPADVGAAIRTIVPASQNAGVLTVLKHFPGLGRVRANTDTSLKAVDSTATVTDPYLRPFADGIKAGSAGVMISSASYPRLDGRAIAAFSRPIVTGLLRDRLGFKGLVVSDDLGAAKAASTVPIGQRAVRFVAAGGDLTLTISASDAAPMQMALIEQAQKDQAFKARLTDAARHVLEAKDKAGLLRC